MRYKKPYLTIATLISLLVLVSSLVLLRHRETQNIVCESTWSNGFAAYPSNLSELMDNSSVIVIGKLYHNPNIDVVPWKPEGPTLQIENVIRGSKLQAGDRVSLCNYHLLPKVEPNTPPIDVLVFLEGFDNQTNTWFASTSGAGVIPIDENGKFDLSNLVISSGAENYTLPTAIDELTDL